MSLLRSFGSSKDGVNYKHRAPNGAEDKPS
jgi:hypothetical protein